MKWLLVVGLVEFAPLVARADGSPPEAPATSGQVVDALALAPRDELVPLTVESAGRPQRVALRAQVLISGDRVVAVDNPLCTTPCTLQVEPGPKTLRLSGEGVERTLTPLVVPPSGLRVRMYAPSMALTIGGILMLSVGLGPMTTGLPSSAKARENPIRGSTTATLRQAWAQ